MTIRRRTFPDWKHVSLTLNHVRRVMAGFVPAIVAISLVAMSSSGVSAQTARTIKLVVPYPPGGAIDVLARIVAEEIGRLHGPAMVIENRPGAGTQIGTEAVVRSVPDGNTLLVNNPAVLLLPHLRKVGYDPLADLAPICNLASTTNVIVVNSASPYRNLDDLLRAARSNPGGLTYGSAPGGVANVGFEMLAHAANFRLTFIPFGGTAPAVNALLGGYINTAMVDYPAAAGQLQAGKLRALAITSGKRIEALPNVPTVAESGYKDYDVELWYGVFAPARTPRETISQVATWLGDAMQSPEVKSKLAIQQLSPVLTCEGDFAAFLRKEFDEFGRAIRDANIRTE